LAEAQVLGHMERDRLPLAVGVGGQNHRVGVARPALELVEDLGLSANGDVAGLEALFDVDPELTGRKVPDVPDRGRDVEAATEVPPDRPGLRRRLDDHEVSGPLSVALRHTGLDSWR